MDIEDVLIGSSKVLVETTEDNYEFERTSDGSVRVDETITPNIVIEALKVNNEITVVFESRFPKEITIYAHDEPTRRDIQNIADKLEMDDDNDFVEQIGYQTYEIPIQVEVRGESSAVITHVYEEELVNPIQI